MIAGKDTYGSKNWMFFIHEVDGEYYLIDGLPHIPLIFLGFYRSIIFKMKAKQISAEEAKSYRYKSKSKSSLKFTLGASGAAGCSYASTKTLSYVESLDLFFSAKFYMIVILGYYLIFLSFLYWYRRRHGFYKLSYDDAKIKVKPKDKKISTIILYHLLNLIFLYIYLDPFIKIAEVLENGGINAKDFLMAIFSMLALTIFVIMPLNMFFGDLVVVKKN